jgi:hypothetical protein
MGMRIKKKKFVLPFYCQFMADVISSCNHS